MMELKIYSPQDTGFIQKIDWNYDELKKEIAAAIESYANSVYTDDMIKKAKEDRAKLNKVSDALKKERTRIRKKLLEPDEQFGKEVQELTGMYVAEEMGAAEPEYAAGDVIDPQTQPAIEEKADVQQSVPSMPQPQMDAADDFFN